MALAGAGSNDATKELTYSALQLFVFGDKKDTTEAISNISADIASWGRDSSIVVAAQPSTPHQVGARMDGAVLPATLTPAVQVQAMATMQVTVPQGAVSGQPIVVQTQSGMHMQVIIPPRLLPGQTFLIQLPPPVQSTVAPTPGVVVQGALVQSVTKWECMMCKTLTDNSNCPRCFADKFGKGLKSKMCITTRVSASPTSTKIQIQIPAHVQPGQTIQMKIADGRTIAVECPLGGQGGGQVMEVDVPCATATVSVETSNEFVWKKWHGSIIVGIVWLVFVLIP